GGYRGGAPRREDDRGGYRGGSDRRDDRPRGPRRDDDRPGGFRRDDSRGDNRTGGGGFRRDDRDRDRAPRRDDDRGPRRDNDRGNSRGGYQGRDDRGGYRGRDDRGGSQGRDDRGGYRGRDDRGGYQGRDDREREPIKRLPIPDEVTGDEIDKDVRQELMSLPKTLAEDVARNLVVVARLIDEDPEQAYAFSRIALRLASRVAAVREAAGFAAYATQRYAEALAEFRASRRMTGSVELWPVMADCERGLGRPERAMAMAGEPEVQKLDKAGQVEMRLVAAGARRDMGQLDAAIVTLQSPELASNAVHSWTPRLRYAYADALLEAGREDEAREWFGKALEADKDGSTDASDRLAELEGVEFVDALGEDDEDVQDTAQDDARPATDTDSGSDVDAGSDETQAHPGDEAEADVEDDSTDGPAKA
ncbi:Tetratricopeptide (TPR) repeat, partial [Streptomyces sp. DpondAA-F4]